jgi:hypothetical protein
MKPSVASDGGAYASVSQRSYASAVKIWKSGLGIVLSNDILGEMSPLDVVRLVLERGLPLASGQRHLALRTNDVTTDVFLNERGIVAALQIATYDAETLTDLTEQEAILVLPELLECDTERLRAFIEGSLLAANVLLAEREHSMATDLLCPPALRHDKTTPEQFRDLIVDREGPRKAWQKEQWGLFYLDDATYAAFLQQADHASDAELLRRRDAALGRMRERAIDVRARFEATHHLLLPASAAVFAAFYEAMTPAEREAYAAFELWRPLGVFEWFQDGGLARPVSDGHDPRLLWRYRSTPPEMIPILQGGGDAQHFGYFYDDPKFMPSGVVVNYARDSAETWWTARTPLAAVEDAIDEFDRREDTERGACQLRLLRDALTRFRWADSDAYDEDSARMLLPYEARTARPNTISGVGPIDRLAQSPAAVHVAEASGDGCPFHDPERTRRWIDAAHAASPLEALAFARDLHWADDEEHHAEALELLRRSYRALDREALAEIAAVHYAHRDLGFVARLT